MQIRILQSKQYTKDIKIEKDQIYDVVSIVGNDFLIQVSMKQKNKFKQVIVNKDNAELIDNEVQNQ